MKIVKLEDWAICFLPQDAWGATFAGLQVPGRLSGRVEKEYVTASPIAKVRYVTTSPMAKVEGRLVTTESGTVYELGTVREDYAEFTRTLPGKEDWDFDGDTPIVLHAEDAQLSEEKKAELKQEQDRIKDIAKEEMILAAMPTPETKH